MQRMGDLILSYPLMIWLARTHPDRPIFVAAEESFYKPLMKISPAVTYFPWSGTKVLLKHDYELVINLSIQEKAAILAHSVRAEHKIGPTQDENGVRFVHGQWQLYRTSLVRNNLYNRYHWADLNALDVVSYNDMARTRFDEPRTLADSNKVGVFIGASEEAKRPAPEFQAALIRELLNRGLRPILFGGPAEKDLGKTIMRLADAPALNMVGKLGLEEFGAIGQTLSLFITPDTGPMHLAAWTGLKSLNLSMGNVNPWETGPYQPGHFVLRADMDCAKGCWHCTRSRLYCHDPFEPSRIAALARRLAAGDPVKKLEALRLPGLDLYRTGKRDGLYSLNRLGNVPPDEERLFSRFWQSFFGARFGLRDESRPAEAWKSLAAAAPASAEALLAHIPKIGRQLTAGLKTGSIDDETFWSESPKEAKPLTGFLHMALENGNYGRPAWAAAMEHLEALIACCR